MASPRLYLHSLDLDRAAALLVDADQEFYRKAIFLDQRALGPRTRGAWVPLEVLWRHMESGYLAPAHFIFHTGHSGSTLISRLLDESPSILGLREPMALRTLASGLHAGGIRPGGAFEETFKRAYQLLVRRFSSKQQVIIKPSSMCNNLAAVLLAQNPANRGMLLFVKLEVFLTNMLDKTQSTSIEGFLAHRFAVLGKIVPDLDLDPGALSKPEKIAFSWLTEATQFHLLTTRGLAPRFLLMDFDEFLAHRQEELLNIFHHFSVPETEETVERLLASPVFGSYSKQPDFAYTTAHRAAILNESRAANRSGIKAGMQFAERLIKTHPDLGEMTANIPLD